MNNTLNFYLASQLNPLIEADPAFQRYPEETAELLRSDIIFGFFNSFFQDLDDILSSGFQGGEWTTVCMRRSALEAIREMYCPTAFGDCLHFLESEELDGAIRRRGQWDGYIPLDQIPAGMPESHWWWWLSN